MTSTRHGRLFGTASRRQETHCDACTPTTSPPTTSAHPATSKDACWEGPCRTGLTIAGGNLQGHTPCVFHWVQCVFNWVTSHVEIDCMIQNHHISDSSHPFSVCSCRQEYLKVCVHMVRCHGIPMPITRFHTNHLSYCVLKTPPFSMQSMLASMYCAFVTPVP